MPLPIGAFTRTGKGDAEASPYRSVEATESALGLLPSMALSSAQLGLILAAVSREMLLRDWSWSMAL
jgi:hypothetical protein